MISRAFYKNPVAWLVIPAGYFVIHTLFAAFASADFMKELLKEDGVYETMQVFVIGAALIIYIGLVRGFPAKAHPWLAAYAIFAVICCFYVTGEEISWGQRIFGWVTPTGWYAVNDHHETNLHNTWGWIDQKPKTILELIIMFGGFGVFLARRYKPSLLPKRFTLLYPPDTLVVISICIIILRAVKITDHLWHYFFYDRLSEVVELYMYYYIALYGLYLHDSFAAVKRPGAISAHTSSPETTAYSAQETP